MLKSYKKIKHILIISLFIVSLIVFLFVFYLNYFIVLERKVIPATLSIGEISGFDVNKSALSFGTISPGSFSQRNIFVENNYPFPIDIKFEVKGNIKDYLLFNKVVHLNEGEGKNITISTIIPTEELYGIYSGEVVSIIKKRFKLII